MGIVTQFWADSDRDNASVRNLFVPLSEHLSVVRKGPDSESMPRRDGIANEATKCVIYVSN